MHSVVILVSNVKNRQTKQKKKKEDKSKTYKQQQHYLFHDKPSSDYVH